jgi:hypothetical protein
MSSDPGEGLTKKINEVVDNFTAEINSISERLGNSPDVQQFDKAITSVNNCSTGVFCAIDNRFTYEERSSGPRTLSVLVK